MSELTLTLLRLGFLAVLWLFVISAVSVMRSDMFGSRVDATKTGAGAKAAAPKPAKQPRRSSKAIPTTLTVTDGPNAGQVVALTDGPLLLGRGTDAALRLDDDYVSTRHARIATNGEQWFVEDLGSTNGTYLGSQRVTAPTPIAIGTPVRLGKTVVELRK
jgi:pSer/pThr/pTyr-binding forkhead associated (FHA) protein